MNLRTIGLAGLLSLAAATRAPQQSPQTCQVTLEVQIADIPGDPISDVMYGRAPAKLGCEWQTLSSFYEQYGIKTAVSQVHQLHTLPEAKPNTISVVYLTAPQLLERMGDTVVLQLLRENVPDGERVATAYQTSRDTIVKTFTQADANSRKVIYTAWQDAERKAGTPATLLDAPIDTPEAFRKRLDAVFLNELGNRFQRLGGIADPTNNRVYLLSTPMSKRTDSSDDTEAAYCSYLTKDLGHELGHVLGASHPVPNVLRLPDGKLDLMAQPDRSIPLTQYFAEIRRGNYGLSVTAQKDIENKKFCR